ncbi:MAG TPA: ABC transporter permease, partial [Alphaproteobacteria bacterium]|nr:ABC transporter permease [Alphaproteobacteria bacterium]
DIASIFAYTLAFVLVIQVLEYGLLQPLERRISRWRR